MGSPPKWKLSAVLTSLPAWTKLLKSLSELVLVVGVVLGESYWGWPDAVLDYSGDQLLELGSTALVDMNCFNGG